ncbi:MAG: oligoendopeptidase F family protein, partial [Planctomycetes bacterium]|nr:oligoendopeptidase F family protein [Planctomycetota bacterium]
MPTRSDIDPRYKWDLSDYYADTAAWKADLAATDGMIARLADLKDTLAQSAAALLKILELRDALGVRLERVYAYATLVKDQDTREPEPQALFDQAGSLLVKYGEASSWYEPELLALPDGILDEWCHSEPKLVVYRHAFDDVLRQRRHVLSAREEELLAMGGKLAQAPREAFTMLTNADLKFPTISDSQGQDVELSEGRYSLYLQSPDRALRKRAFEGTLGTYLSFKNTIAATLAGSIQKDVFHARTHNYDSALQAALDPDNVPVAVYDNLIATVRKHLPKLHRYLEIRRRKLGLDQVHVYDTIVPLVDEEAPKIGYDDAVAKIVTGLEPLGAEYLEPMKRGFAGSWIDVCETQGKRSGAYSMGIYAVHPYILLNYNDTYNAMFTVAHEVGHSMHTWFTQQHQPPVYGDYPIFLAEVASTVNEVILGDDLRKRATNQAERLFLLNLEIEKIRGT